MLTLEICHDKSMHNEIIECFLFKFYSHQRGWNLYISKMSNWWSHDEMMILVAEVISAKEWVREWEGKISSQLQSLNEEAFYSFLYK